VCPANIPQSVCDTFEVEGNAVDDSGAGLPEDWNSIISSSDANGVLPQGQLSGPSGGASPRIYIDDTGVADQIFTTGGSKDANSLSGWRHTIGSVPDKDEILHGGAAAYTDAVTGHRILAFFADRFDNSGDSNIGLWFFKDPNVSLNSNGTFNGTHLTGDLFVIGAFTQGGSTSTLLIYKWVDSAADCSGQLFNNHLCFLGTGPAFVNSGPIAVNWPYRQKGSNVVCNQGPCTIPQPGLFFEGALDLDALGISGTNSCFSSFLLETRSSQTITATLKDFAFGNFNTCPHISVDKVPSQAEACEGTPISFTYTVSSPASASVTVNVTVVDDNGTPGDPSDDFCLNPGAGGGACSTFPVGNGGCSFQLAPGQSLTCSTAPQILSPGTHTNTVTATATFGSFTDTDTATATVVINPNPTCTVSPATATVCFGQTATFTANPTGGTAPYTFLWNTGATTQAITVGTTGTYSVVVTDSKGCTTSCQASLLVDAQILVSVNSAERCSDGPAQTLTASPSGGSGGFTFLWNTGATTQSIDVTAAGTYSVVVTDSLGCSAGNSGTLTVNPKPVITIDTVACSTSSSITLTAHSTGGTGAVTFVWDDGTVGATRTVNATGSYSVTGTDSKGCTGTASKTVGLCAP